MGGTTRLALLIGIILIVVGVGLTFYGTTKTEWYIGQGTDLSDVTTWVIRDQSIGFATPWTYDVGTLPEQTRIFLELNVTTSETRTYIARPGPGRYQVLDAGSGQVVQSIDAGSYAIIPRPLYTTSRASQYKVRVQAVLGTLLAGWSYDNTPVDFDACIQANRLVTEFPYRLLGAGLAVAGVALMVVSRIRGRSAAAEAKTSSA